MSLGNKLNVKAGMKLKVFGKPLGLDLGDVVTTRESADGVFVFVKTLDDVEALCGPAIEAALADPYVPSSTEPCGGADDAIRRA